MFVIQFGVLCVSPKHCLDWNKHTPFQMKFCIIFGEKLTLKNVWGKSQESSPLPTPFPLEHLQYDWLLGSSVSDLNFHSFAVISLNLTGLAFWKRSLGRDISAVLHDQRCLTGVKDIWKWAMVVTWVAGQQWRPEVANWFSNTVSYLRNEVLFLTNRGMGEIF